MTIVCGDSHTATHGAMGALAFGIGTSEVEHVLATQTLIQAPGQEHADRGQRRPRRRGQPEGRDPRDHRQDRHRRRHRPCLRICRQHLPRHVDGRPHDRLQHVDRGGRARRARRARREDHRLCRWAGPMRPRVRRGSRRLPIGAPCRPTPAPNYDKEAHLDAADIAPHVTWGTNPEQAAPVTGRVPDPAQIDDPLKRAAVERALQYMQLAAQHAADRCAGAARLHRLVHQQPDRGSARRRGDRQGPQGRRRGHRAGRAGLGPRQAPGRGGRARPRLPRSRVRMARRRAARCACR